MSVGPAALGNVLVQRLDAVLGTTMSAASANQVSGARPDAVSQPGNLEKPGASDGSARDPRQGVQTGGARGDRQNTVVDPKIAAALALAARGLVTSSDTTASAPTTLGTTARAILALLAQFPEAAPAVQGRAPLWTTDAQPGQPAAGAGPMPAAQAGQQPAQTGAQASHPMPGQMPAQATAQQQAPALAASVAATLDGDGLAAGAKQERPAGPGASPNASKGPEAAAHAALAAGGPSARALGQALRQALQGSGLFYESHLTDMVFGRATPAQLRSEPQAVLGKNPPTQDPAPSRPRTGAAPSGRPGADAAPSTGGSSSPAPGTPVSGIHQDLTVLVRQQLDVLANQTLTWQGEAWPGTPMEWEVERDPYGGDPESAVSTWATRLKLDLPRLGLVDARLNLAGDQIVLQLIAPHSAAEINDSSDALRSRLLAAGLTLSNLSVSVVEPRPEIPTDI